MTNSVYDIYDLNTSLCVTRRTPPRGCGRSPGAARVPAPLPQTQGEG